ncbi:MAG: amino acid ABC transporter permease [Phage AS32]|nr:MAG: amino acid ABC transporter permease [Phage AS32]
MSTSTVSTAVANPVRTVAQGSLAWVVAEGIDAFLYDLNERQYGVAIVAFAMVFSFVQNLVENHFGKGFFRQIPPTEAPIIEKGE